MNLDGAKLIAKTIVVEGTKTVCASAGATVLITLVKDGATSLKNLDVKDLL